MICNSRVFKFEMLPKKEKYDFWLDFRAFLAHNSTKWGGDRLEMLTSKAIPGSE